MFGLNEANLNIVKFPFFHHNRTYCFLHTFIAYRVCSKCIRSDDCDVLTIVTSFLLLITNDQRMELIALGLKWQSLPASWAIYNGAQRLYYLGILNRVMMNEFQTSFSLCGNICIYRTKRVATRVHKGNLFSVRGNGIAIAKFVMLLYWNCI